MKLVAYGFFSVLLSASFFVNASDSISKEVDACISANKVGIKEYNCLTSVKNQAREFVEAETKHVVFTGYSENIAKACAGIKGDGFEKDFNLEKCLANEWAKAKEDF